jgi:3-oxoacyl-[acyl-carrier-protein] synthase-3
MKIKKIATYLPQQILTTEELSELFPDWSAQKIIEKTGIRKRHIAGNNEYASDMAVAAAEKLFASGVDREQIDYLIVCTQSPDHLLPATAPLVQSRLKLSPAIGAIDINIGCSGYIYALSIAYGLIKSEQVKSILIITTDTYTKFLDETDKSTRALFGDAATATLAELSTQKNKANFLFGTDGRGAEDLIVANSGMKTNLNCDHHRLYMNGPEILSFALEVIPNIYKKLLTQSKMCSETIKFFIFHQANLSILECIRDKLRIDPERFIIDIAATGNTVSSTIPIALNKLIESNELTENDPLLLLGFGVGYSWAGCILNVH